MKFSKIIVILASISLFSVLFSSCSDNGVTTPIDNKSFINFKATGSVIKNFKSDTFTKNESGRNFTFTGTTSDGKEIIMIQFVNLPESQVDIDLADLTNPTHAFITYSIQQTNGTTESYKLTSGNIHVTANNKNTIEADFSGMYESGLTTIGFTEGKLEYYVK
mgnify:CR=1 FL=1